MDSALVILCGGNSTRMGTDKALLPFGNACLLEYIVQRFRPYFPKIYLSVKKKGDYAHLNLPVTEIPDIYMNAGPMSGIFSALSMIDEPAAFFMSADTPFLEPETGLALLNALEDADICSIRGKASYLETATAAYSKNCITTVGKCLLLHQLTFKTLREKCNTKYLTEKAISEFAPVPIDIQFYNLDTRENYYHALHILSGMKHPDSSQALIEYFEDTRNLFLRNTPIISFVARPGTLISPFIERILPLLEREGLKITYLVKEDHSIIFKNVFFDPTPENLSACLTGSDLILTENFGSSAPNKIEVLRKDWSEVPCYDTKDLIAVLSDFPYKSENPLPVFELGKPKNFVTFIQEYLSKIS